MRILVTGGAGFIGTHLVNRLTGLNHEVVVLDNLSTGKKENVNKNARLITGDIRDSFDVSKSIKGCDAVFHLAAMADAREDGEKVYEVNFLGSKNVFSAAKEISARIIFTSSAAVYGNMGVCREEAECSPVNEYGKSKLKAENFLAKTSPESFIARPFNVYGRGGAGAVNKFCKKIPAYEEVTVFGAGMQTRDYVYISDVVDALLLGFENSGTYNVGTGTEMGLLELIDIIGKLSNAKAEIRFEKPVEGEIMRSKADITKIRQLGWQPKITIEEGVKMLVEYSE